MAMALTVMVVVVVMDVVKREAAVSDGEGAQLRFRL